MTDEQKAFVAAVEKRLEGVDWVSVGACPDCDQCGLGSEPTDEELDLAGEEHFSWAPCDVCGNKLGGSRYPCHGLIDGELWHGACCPDCVQYIANDELPESWGE